MPSSNSINLTIISYSSSLSFRSLLLTSSTSLPYHFFFLSPAIYRLSNISPNLPFLTLAFLTFLSLIDHWLMGSTMNLRLQAFHPSFPSLLLRSNTILNLLPPMQFLYLFISCNFLRYYLYYKLPLNEQRLKLLSPNLSFQIIEDESLSTFTYNRQKSFLPVLHSNVL